MNPDLDHLIALQRLDSAASDAQRKLADEPQRQAAFDARIAEVAARLAAAKERVATVQAAKRELDKEVAVHQGRLSKFRDQAMAVKTNQEYHAIQHEIAFAQNAIKTIEDKILENMMESDEATGAVKAAEAAQAAEKKAVEADLSAMKTENGKLRASLEALAKERAGVVAQLAPQTLAMFELVSKRRNGVAMAEARAGICTLCHVRLRPQVFNNVLKNESIVQCDSCQRILYVLPPTLETGVDGITTPSR